MVLRPGFHLLEETAVLRYVVSASDPGGVQVGPEETHCAPREGRYRESGDYSDEEAATMAGSPGADGQLPSP